MACVSDIDLATLHRNRLEERVHYKLSWWARRMITDTQKQLKNHRNVILSTGRASRSRDRQRETAPEEFAPQAAHPAELRHVGTMAADAADAADAAVAGQRRNGQQRNVLENGVDVDATRMTATALTGPRVLPGQREYRQNGHRQHHIDELEAEQRLIEKCCAKKDEDYFTMERRRRSGTWPRTRSLNAPSPFQQFGPCGRIMKNSAMVMQIQDPASQRLTWYKSPLAVLVIKKARDHTVLPPFIQLVEWLIQTKNMVVWVEEAVLDDQLLIKDNKFQTIKDKLITFKDDRDTLTDRIDFIVCLGGDGTLLYASSLFQQSVPPVMAFHLGSLGFLTPFQFDNFQEQVTNVLEGNATLTLRSRLRCIFVQKGAAASASAVASSAAAAMHKSDGSPQSAEDCAAVHNQHPRLTPPGLLSSGAAAGSSPSPPSSQSSPAANILVLNEVVIDRGPSPYLSNIDLFLDGKHITSVQGDGLIISTPTGSTAYSGSAGGSMVHPSVPCIMVTPICPHSLSFRPIVVPAGVELKIAISPDSRNTSWVSFDGRNHQELLHGDSLRVTTSIYPVPSICAQDQISDWFDSLAECLHWNVRKGQKSLDDVPSVTESLHNAKIT